MNRLVPVLVLFLGLIATRLPGGLTVDVLVADGRLNFVVLHNEYLNGPGGQYYFVMQPDCNLVLFGESGTPLASSNTSFQSLPLNCSLVMQDDGNLVIYNLSSTNWDSYTTVQAIWAQGTTSKDSNNSYLFVGGDGNIVFYYANSTRRTVDYGGSIYSNNQFKGVGSPSNIPSFLPISSDYKAWVPSSSLSDEFPYLPAGYFLSAGKRLLTVSKNFSLELGTDCNLVSSRLANNGSTSVEVLWRSGTNRSDNSSCQLTLQQNGVLQIQSTASSEVYWNSTNGNGDSSVSWILTLDPTNGNLTVSEIQSPNNIFWTNLDVPSPTISPSPGPQIAPVKRIIWPTVAGVVGGAFALAIVALGLYLYFRQYFLDPDDKAFQARLRAIDGNSRAFSGAKIKRATNNYNNVIGRGGFGDVFYGKLPDGREVAAKVLSANSRQSKQEFYNEIELLSKVHHKYLVSLLGYSSTHTFQILIYEYMSGGNLRQRLQGESDAEHPLSWQQRTSIMLQVAEGLEYLHHKCSPPIIHRDVKSTNILLTDKSVAKVADFGLSKLKTIGQEDATHVTTAVKGTPGYLDPEYHETGLLTEKSDVYAFGVVLLEILTGRHHMFIAQGVRDAWRLEQFDEMADPNVGEDYDREELVHLVELALWCTKKSGPDRPSMDKVVRRLHDILLPPSEPSMVDSPEEDEHHIASMELMPLASGTQFSSDSAHFTGESSISGTSSGVPRDGLEI